MTDTNQIQRIQPATAKNLDARKMDWIGYDLAGLPHQIIEVGTGRVIADLRSASFSEASLLAAAPQLLEALENIENDDKRIPIAIWYMRCEAIKKAKGIL